MLVRLLYASRATEPVDAGTIDAILEQSRGYNADHGITGLLCCYEDGNGFLQALEGARSEVNRLDNRIVCDARHEDVTLLLYHEIDERRFANWRMGKIDFRKVNPGLLLRYSERPLLDPVALSARQAEGLLGELVETVQML